MIPTIKDVACLAGVSISTVSRVLNKSGYVSEDVQKRVQSAVGQLGYKPNSIAQSLKKSASRTIGLVVTDITNPYFAAIAKESEGVLSSYGYNLIICNTNESPDKERRHLEMLFDRRVDGVLLCSTGRSNEAVRRLVDAGICVILIDRNCEGLSLDIIKDDNTYGSYLLTRHLLERGHRRIALFRGAQDSTASTERERGWRDALAEAGIEPQDRWVFTCGVSGERTQEAMRALLGQDSARPTAIFACNSLIAKQAIMQLNAESVAIPGDMALAGYGLEEFKTLYRPSITCIVQRPDYVGHLSAQLMMERLRGKGGPRKREVFLSPELFEGESV